MAESEVGGDEVEPEPLVLEGAPRHRLAHVHQPHPADGGRHPAVGGGLQENARLDMYVTWFITG